MTVEREHHNETRDLKTVVLWGAHSSANPQKDERNLVEGEQEEIGWMLILYLTSLNNCVNVRT